MAVISIDEAKAYLRVDSGDEETLIIQLMESAEKLTLDAARLSEEDLNNAEKDVEADVRIGTYYALGYLFEHREEADHRKLTNDLRCLLFGSREARF